MDVMELDDGPVLSVGNSKGELFVWEIAENQFVDEYLKKNWSWNFGNLSILICIKGFQFFNLLLVRYH